MLPKMRTNRSIACAVASRMTPTPTLSTRADRAAIAYRAARKGRKASTAKQKTAIKLRALAMIQELRKSGTPVRRKHERALRV